MGALPQKWLSRVSELKVLKGVGVFHSNVTGNGLKNVT
jgi:hypothetical protein